ncbi:MAG: Maf-like protein [Ignavibacterium sp.]
MIDYPYPIYLASKSPRRKKLLQQINLKNIHTVEINLEEKFSYTEKPVSIVLRLSKEKLNLALEKIHDGVIITADTIVVINNKIIGKPKDEKDAERILKMLSNRTHIVYTGFCVYNVVKNKLINDYEKTFVKFRKLEADEIRDYINSGSPMDKAGAYGIQEDYGAVFVEKINGCYYNVVGLPLQKVYQSLLKVM